MDDSTKPRKPNQHQLLREANKRIGQLEEMLKSYDAPRCFICRNLVPTVRIAGLAYCAQCLKTSLR